METDGARIARLEAEVAGAQRAVDMFGPTARQALEAIVGLSALRDDFTDLRDAFDASEKRLTARLDELSAEVRGFRVAREEARSKLTLAVIAGIFTVLSAIVAAAASIASILIQ